jgi:N-acetylglucosamine-6-phosphate deacetylase
MLQSGPRHGAVVIQNGRIASVWEPSQAPHGFSNKETVDVRGRYLAPGLIDIHLHGSVAVDVMETDVDGLDRLSAFLLSEGVTGYFPTLAPARDRVYASALASIAKYLSLPKSELSGCHGAARILGVHFEGPFLNRNKCGALKPELFRGYDGQADTLDILSPIDTSSAAGSNGSTLTTLMTMAPEIPHGIDLVRTLASKGVRVFVGHSQADPETLDLSLAAGAAHVTHFPNALDTIHHRKPGAAAWALVHPAVTLDCIADLQHVDPLFIQLIYRMKGAERMALISDAIPPAGLGDGEYSVWGEQLTVEGGRTRLATSRQPDTLAGSTITLRQAVRNVVSLGVPLNEAISMASLVPARAAGISRLTGSIEPRKAADLIVLDDSLEVRLAVVGGMTAFDRM